MGDEFHANTYTSIDQIYSSVTALNDGGFVVTWSSTRPGFCKAPWASTASAMRRTAPGRGASSTPTRTPPSDQIYSSVTALNDGGFVVTWSSDGQDGSGYGIYGQRYAADGSPVGDEFHANTYTTNDQVFSSVTALNDGGFVVTWSSDGQDGSGYGIYGQRYAADGTPVGSEFRVNQITSGDQFAETFYGSETLATLADGHLVQVWAGNGPEEVFFRLIDVPSANTAPTLAVANALTSLAEGSYANHVKVADITITDDGAGTNNLTLSGNDAALFEIVGKELFLRAGTVLDFEGGNTTLDVIVQVDDAAVPGSPDDSETLSISVTDVAENAAPILALESAVLSLSEGTTPTV